MAKNSTGNSKPSHERRAAIVDALNKSIEIFTSHNEKTFNEVISSGIRPIAETAGLDRIVFYRRLNVGGNMRFGQTFRWDMAGGGLISIDDELAILPDIPVLTRWISLLSKGGIIRIRKSDMAEDERAFLNAFDIKSIMIMPIFIYGEFWGAVCFQDHTNDQYFDENCADLLHSAARLFANATIKSDLAQNAENAYEELERRERMVETLNKAAILFLSQTESTFDDTMTVGVRLFVDTVDLDRLSVWRNTMMDDGLHASQIYRWDKESGGTTLPTPELADVTYANFAPRWEEVLASDEIINSPSHLLPEAAMLKSFGVVSAFITPIFLSNKFWGFVLLEDRENERYFDNDSADIMRSAAYLLANTVIGAEMDKRIANANERTRLMLDSIPLSCQWWDKNMNVIDCNNAAVKLFGVKDKQEFIDRFFELSPEYQRDGQRSDEKAVMLVKKAFEEGRCVFEWLHRVADGSLMDAEVFLERIKYGDDFILLGYIRDLREQKQLLHDIEQANELNRTLIKSAPFGITLFDEDLHFIDFNDVILNAYGASKEQFVNNFADFSPEYQDDGSKSADKITEIMKRTLDGEHMLFEWTHRSILGELIPFEVTTVRVKNNEKYIGVAFQYDMRNIKKAEKEVTEAQELTRTLTESSPISYTLLDEDLNIVNCNEIMMSILGCTDKGYFLKHYWDIFVPETQPDGKNSIDKAKAITKRMSLNRQISYEWVHRSADGRLIPMENNLMQIIHNDKKFYAAYKYDLRNIKKMSEDLQEQSEQLKIKLEQQELIAEITKGFIASGDSEKDIKEAIAKLGKYHKVSLVVIFEIDYERSTTVPKYFWSEDGKPPAYTNFDLFSLAKASFDKRLPECSSLPMLPCPNIAESQNKEYLPLLNINVSAFMFAPLYVDGCLWGIFGMENFIPRDWTKNEKDFISLIAPTISGVIWRNTSNTALKDALNKANVASKAKGDFLSNMSHEIRTPLNAIIGMTVIGKNATEIGRKDYSFSKIEDASAHLLNVINDILDMSKIEANKFELVPVEFNFEKTFQQVVNIQNFRVEEKNQKLMVRIHKDIPKTLFGDEQRLTQVITNLLGNAVKFTDPEGSISLDARFLSEDNEICTIEISVTDTGIGISKEKQKLLFQAFQQAESSTARKYGGTGLGLSISKRIVEMMGGKIWVQSELKKGSTFAFTIQAKRVEEKEIVQREKVDLETVRVLVIDDDPEILAFFMDVAQRYNIHCDTAPNSKYALQLVEGNGDYDIYFIDWKMQDMDGIAMTSEIRSKERVDHKSNGGSVVVMISAADMDGIRKDAEEAGVNNFLSKPLFPSIIIETISDCLGVKRQVTKDIKPGDGLSLAGRKILLAEDVEINREIVLTLLETTELQIDCAENGKQAVEKYSEDPGRYELILMDVQMPEMDGYQATRNIRKLEKEWKEKTGNRSKNIPIIAMTANVFKEDIDNCISAGMNDHIGKPLDFEIFMEKLQTYLK